MFITPKPTVQYVLNSANRLSGSTINEPRFLLTQDYLNSDKRYRLVTTFFVQFTTEPASKGVFLYSNDLITNSSVLKSNPSINTPNRKTLLNIALPFINSSLFYQNDSNELIVEPFKTREISFELRDVTGALQTPLTNFVIVLEFSEI
jgi:hypothetical protein